MRESSRLCLARKANDQTEYSLMITRSAAIFSATLILAACGSREDQPGNNPGSARPVTTASNDAPASGDGVSAEKVILQVRESERFGPHVTDGDGRALYMFTRDSDGESACEGRCLQDWPPMIQKGVLTAGPGVDESRIATIVREGGLRQVTYAGRPLYYYVAAQSSNPASVQGLRSHDGDWYLVSPDGAPNRTDRN